jgi:3-oxoacyl-[acyl-carrier protein] reductase
VEEEMAGRLNGRTAIITGSSRGIGRGIARVFAAAGARVLIVARDE